MVHHLIFNYLLIILNYLINAIIHYHFRFIITWVQLIEIHQCFSGFTLHFKYLFLFCFQFHLHFINLYFIHSHSMYWLIIDHSKLTYLIPNYFHLIFFNCQNYHPWIEEHLFKFNFILFHSIFCYFHLLISLIIQIIVNQNYSNHFFKFLNLKFKGEYCYYHCYLIPRFLSFNLFDYLNLRVNYLKYRLVLNLVLFHLILIKNYHNLSALPQLISYLILNLLSFVCFSQPLILIHILYIMYILLLMLID